MEIQQNNNKGWSLSTRQLLTGALTITIAGIALFFATRDADWNQLQVVVQNAEYHHIVIATLSLCLLFPLRGRRWHLFLKTETTGDTQRSWIQAMWGVGVGYLGNMFLPARAGEVIRSVALAKAYKTTNSHVFATVVAERLLEAVIQVIVFSVMLGVIVDVSPLIRSASSTIVAIGVVGVVILILLPQLEKSILSLLRWLPLPDRFYEWIKSIVEQFILGMQGVQNSRVLVGFVIYTVAVTLAEGFALYQVALAFGVSMTPAVVLFLYLSLGLASALPSTPGAVGIYQYVTVLVLQPLGYADEPALVFISAYQILVVSLVVVWGVIGIWQLGIKQT